MNQTPNVFFGASQIRQESSNHSLSTSAASPNNPLSTSTPCHQSPSSYTSSITFAPYQGQGATPVQMPRTYIFGGSSLPQFNQPLHPTQGTQGTTTTKMEHPLSSSPITPNTRRFNEIDDDDQHILSNPPFTKRQRLSNDDNKLFRQPVFDNSQIPGPVFKPDENLHPAFNSSIDRSFGQ